MQTNRLKSPASWSFFLEKLSKSSSESESIIFLVNNLSFRQLFFSLSSLLLWLTWTKICKMCTTHLHTLCAKYLLFAILWVVLILYIIVLLIFGRFFLFLQYCRIIIGWISYPFLEISTKITDTRVLFKNFNLVFWIVKIDICELIRQFFFKRKR